MATVDPCPVMFQMVEIPDPCVGSCCQCVGQAAHVNHFDQMRDERAERIEKAARAYVRSRERLFEHKQKELDGWTPAVAAWNQERDEIEQESEDAFAAMAAAIGPDR